MVAFLFAGQATADTSTRRIFLDLDLRSRTGDIVSLDSATLTFIDDSGRTQRAPVSTLVAILPLADANPAPRASARPAGDERRPTSGLLELTDSQRFPGQRASSDAAETITWRHPRFGRITFPIDAVASVSLDERAAAARLRDGTEPPGTRDTVFLTNGDRVSGFLTSLADPIVIEGDAGPVTIPSERVVAILASNPATPLHGMVAWLDDSTVVSLESIDPESPDAVSLRMRDGQTANYAIGSIQALAFDASRIVPLASIAPRSQTPVGERGNFEPLREPDASPGDAARQRPPAALGAEDLELPGPMTVVWSLPPGARRLAASAELPPATRPWGDCELVVRIDGVESLRERLNAQRPFLDFTLPASGRELSITIEPGAYGPINDRVTLHRAFILTDKPAG